MFHRPGGKDLQDLSDLKRSPLHSFMRQFVQPDAPRPKGPDTTPASYPALAAFSPARRWQWLISYLRFRFGPRHAYQDYTQTDGDNGIYDLGGDEVRVALAGDWGTGTDEAAEVALQIAEFKAHFTIHLGDVYYVGDHREVDENFLGETGPKPKGFTSTRWPRGSRGSFSLLGNHEMYARGIAYFKRMLPQLGMLEGGVAQQQKASFFCLENQHWRIIAIDTGYDSVRFPLIEKVWNPNCRLRPELLAWIRDVVRPSPDDPRGIILLSHHQPLSAFDSWYVRPATQIAAYFTKPVLWFWGHEHRLAIYPRFASGGITMYGRCIGHGGMPVELSTAAQVKHQPPECPRPLVDPRRYGNDEHLKVGMNGFVRLILRAEQLRVEYVDLHGLVVHSEAWRADADSLVPVETGEAGCLTEPPAHMLPPPPHHTPEPPLAPADPAADAIPRA